MLRPQYSEVPADIDIPKTDLDWTPDLIATVTQMLIQLDTETRSHCERVAEQAREFGAFLNLSSNEIQTLSWGGYLHDIGKSAIPKSILHKPSSLTPGEWNLMKQHVQLGEELCRSVCSTPSVLTIIRYHHERWDGSGYPYGVAGEDIPYLARIIQILDVYDALTHERVYKPAFKPSLAIATLIEETKRGWYQPELIQQFLGFLAPKLGPNVVTLSP